LNCVLKDEPLRLGEGFESCLSFDAGGCVFSAHTLLPLLFFAIMFFRPRPGVVLRSSQARWFLEPLLSWAPLNGSTITRLFGWVVFSAYFCRAPLPHPWCNDRLFMLLPALLRDSWVCQDVLSCVQWASVEFSLCAPPHPRSQFTVFFVTQSRNSASPYSSSFDCLLFPPPPHPVTFLNFASPRVSRPSEPTLSPDTSSPVC